METILGKNWKTAIAGILSAVAIAVYPLIATGEINWNSIFAAAGLAILSWFTKDKDVTGIGLKATTNPVLDATKPKAAPPVESELVIRPMPDDK